MGPARELRARPQHTNPHRKIARKPPHFIQISLQVANLGAYSLSVIYAALVLSCMFLPSIIIKRLTAKWTMVVCMFCYTTYIAGQFYPEFYTLIPGAIIVGMGAAPMWSAKCTYLTQVSAYRQF